MTDKRAGNAWRALRHCNFRLYVVGQSISLIGTWMTRVAMAWLVYRLTHSAWMLGAVAFVQQAPVLALSPVAGVLVDRMDRRRLLVATQGLAMLESLALAALTLSGAVTLHWIFALALLDGVVGTLDLPLRMAFLPRMVPERADLANAIAINSSMINASRLVGPSLAGMLIAASSEGWCFLVDGLSYGAVIASILAMRLPAEQSRRAAAHLYTQLREGWSYVSASLPIRSILTLFAVVSLMGYPFVMLMPVFAAQILQGGPRTLGFLMGAIGVGALAAALWLAVRRSPVGLVELLLAGAMVFGAGLVGLGLSRSFALSLLLAAAAGYGMVQDIAGVNTVLQTIVEDSVRGRVMSYYTMAFTGMAPFGSFFLGWLANRIGAAQAVMASGACCLAVGLWFWLRLGRVLRALEPVYRRLGILA